MNHFVGEQVVNVQNLKMGNVVEINLQEEKVKLHYTDGLVEWVDADNTKTLLID